jgi:hypothetical protein
MRAAAGNRREADIAHRDGGRRWRAHFCFSGLDDIRQPPRNSKTEGNRGRGLSNFAGQLSNRARSFVAICVTATAYAHALKFLERACDGTLVELLPDCPQLGAKILQLATWNLGDLF